MIIYLIDNTFAPQQASVSSSPWIHSSPETTISPDGHFSQMVVALAQPWPHCTALGSIPTCCLWHLYFRKYSVSSHSTYINIALWRFLLYPVPQLKWIHCLIKHNPSFFLVLTFCIYVSVSGSLRIITNCSTYGEILLLRAPFWATEWLY